MTAWRRLHQLGDFAMGIFDYGVGPPPIYGLGTPQKFARQQLEAALRVHLANEESWSYYAGSWVPDIVAGFAGGAIATEEAAAQAPSWFTKNVFRWGRGSFKVRGQWVRDAWHFHLGPGKGLMKHHLPHQFRGWRGNLWNNLKKWKW